MGTGNVAASYFLGVVFMSFFYSLYLVAFAASVYFSFNVRGRKVRPNKVILSASIVLFVIINVVRAETARALAL
jgi:amino acid transporter